MRICIYGAGAMGSSLGALFFKQNIPCDLITRNEAHVQAIKRDGLRLVGCENGTVYPNVIVPSEMTGKYDVVFLATKQRENEKIARFLLDYLAEDGALVTVQNGLPERSLAETVGEDRVYGCALSWGAERSEAGAVKITSESGYRFFLGAYGRGTRLDYLTSLLQKVGIVTVGNLNELRYAKLAVNSAFSSLSALSGLTFGELAKRYKKPVLALMREAFAVARAAGCKKLPLNGHNLFRVFGGFWAGLLLPFAMKKYRDTLSGMLLDLQAGRRCEIDFISGMVCAEGARYGVPTPMQERVTALVHDVENGLCELSPESIVLLAD